VSQSAKEASRIELVNKVAGHFFRVVQDSLWQDSLLNIARLTDSAKTIGKDNLTINKLPQLITDNGLNKRAKELIEVAVEKAAFCRDWRNRHIAHRDLKLALGSVAEPLKGASRAQVKEALGALSDVLNALSIHYMDSTTLFDSLSGSDGAVSLLYALDDGLRFESERNERINSGSYRVEDYQARDL
jgi:HEPN superfamily AbiU2-like protein